MDYGVIGRLRATVKSVSSRTDLSVRFGTWHIDAAGLNRRSASRRTLDVRQVATDAGDVVLLALDRDATVPIIVVNPASKLLGTPPPMGFRCHVATLPAAAALPGRVMQLADLVGLGHGLPKPTDAVVVTWLDRQVTFGKDGRPVPVQAEPPERWLDPWREMAPVNMARAAGVNRHGVEPLHEERVLSSSNEPTSVTVCPPDWRGSMRVFAHTGGDCHFSGYEVMATSPDPRLAMARALEWAFGNVQVDTVDAIGDC